MKNLRLLLFVPALLLASCSDDDDDWFSLPYDDFVETRELEVRVEGWSYNDTALNIEVNIDGISREVIEKEGIRFRIQNDRAAVPLVHVGGQKYQGIVLQNGDDDPEYRFIVERKNDATEDSFNSFLYLPGSFTISSPQNQKVYTSLDQQVDLRWSQVAEYDRFVLLRSWECLYPTGVTDSQELELVADATDTGAYAFTLGDILPVHPDSSALSCVLGLELRYGLVGSPDPILESGLIAAQSRRQVYIRYIPGWPFAAD